MKFTITCTCQWTCLQYTTKSLLNKIVTIKQCKSLVNTSTVLIKVAVLFPNSCFVWFNIFNALSALSLQIFFSFLFGPFHTFLIPHFHITVSCVYFCISSYTTWLLLSSPTNRPHTYSEATKHYHLRMWSTSSDIIQLLDHIHALKRKWQHYLYSCMFSVFKSKN